ncbi:MAG: SufD family Fe-S cluster assembly protein [Methanothrix sp.]
MPINEIQEQRGRNPSYRSIPFETNLLYKKYFVNLDLSRFENKNTKEEVIESYDESLLTNRYAKMGIKFSAVIYDGVLAKGTEAVHTGDTAYKERVRDGLPFDKFSAFAYDFSLEPIVVEFGSGKNELNMLFLDSGMHNTPASISFRVPKNVKATINEYYFSLDNGKESLNGAAQLFELDENSELIVNEIHCESENTNSLVTRSFLTLDNAKLEFNAFYTGGATSRQRSVFNNSGKGSKINVNESIIGSGTQKFDINTNISNLKPNSSCNYEVRAVLADDSSGIVKSFAKMIKGTEGSESHIKERGLIYDKNAKITMMPDMSIDESYVKASHSSSTSPIPEDDIFYISSRGLDKEKAKFLVGSGLIYELLKNIKNHDSMTFSMLLAKHRLETKKIGVPEMELKSYGVWYDQ